MTEQLATILDLGEIRNFSDLTSATKALMACVASTTVSMTVFVTNC